ncbi:MAG TPA: FtsX-like permease family protein, partial [Acidimicrobiales bacterium]|nr:FtsX-like permease family protein [Acidimicrobiales bacterium]
KADRSIRPEAIALGVFGGIVALAALLIAGQLIGRQLLRAAAERRVLRALGANPAMTAADGLLLLIGAVLLGALLAVVVAISLSPLAPFGPVRAVYPYGGFSFDWTVLGAGFAVLVLGLATAAVVLGYRGAPHRVAARAGDGDRTSRTMSAVSASGLPPAAVEGIRFALGRRGGSEAVPMRSTIVGIVLAIVVLIGTVTFGASLDHLVSDPVLYGWNWDYALVAGADIPQHQAAVLLNRDHDIAAWSGDYTGTLDVGGTNIPVLGTPPNASVSPSILSGHPIGSDGQIVLGALTLAQLHRYLGQTVRVSNGVDPPVHLKIVGTAALPALGSATGGSHLELGVGGVVAYSLLPAAARNPFDNPVPGPNVTLVRLRNGVNRATALHSLQAIAHATTNVYNFGVFVSGVVRPAEIVNYRAMGGTPAYLSAGLAAGALTALTLTLVASVGRRRRDLALLKTLGFSRRQVAATVAWHATISVVLGVAVGIPLGIALGRLLWNLFARNINVVPSPSVPVEWVLAVGFGAIVLANVVAAFPARVAARTPTALALRSE